MLLPGVLLAAAALPAQQPLRIAAAADLQPVLPALTAAYQRSTGIALSPSFGSSSTLAQQITQGAPFDVFLSADCSHPEQLTATHLAGNPVAYALGELVLWARKDSPAQPLSLSSLRSARVTRIAQANDQHAPYGQAATAELTALHLREQLGPRLVLGENIMQAAQFADTGNAQAAFLSRTIADSPHFRETGTTVALPPLYPPLRQCGVALTGSTQRLAADAFLRWLTSSPAQELLRQHGLKAPR